METNIVGKPVSILCQSENATVTMCHSRTKDLNHKLSDADVIIVAVGVPKFISGDQIPEGAAVIDVGIHNIDGKYVVMLILILLKKKHLRLLHLSLVALGL